MAQPDVLVTGSAGHLGCALMLSLPSLGYTPLGLDILQSDTTSVIGSVADRALIRRLLAENPTIKHILHTATLHKPHVGSHTKEDFIQTNITGTLILLEEAARLGSRLESFVYTSTTSAFGSALSPAKGLPAAWIDEAVVPVPKNIYGVTKVAAEDMCYLVHKQTALPVLVLRTSRFFPEEDDDEERRSSMNGDNLKLCELTYRRVDIADVVQSCVCAMGKARELGWGKYIISAPSPFLRDEETLKGLDSDPGRIIRHLVPAAAEAFAKKGWKWLERIDRVYDSSKAMKELGWKPRYTFEASIARLCRGEDWKSELTAQVGKKGYHSVPTGVYTLK
ncbi:NAD dependent epimerase/dehydratase family protein [Pleurostoma richardsiae]|uniref:NAD dependent epimerase/dehydratase family protein n=1 Tax=Pleurostoma richardsiae TaxID=41990 RepID=A0AA38RN28_9PEZI|nr:NAD dependent epimerase/dehydratase family protein [Pleurostoma richardsiae]